jgi:hypothetical protein
MSAFDPLQTFACSAKIGSVKLMPAAMFMCSLAFSACSTGPNHQPLTAEAFETAKQKCGASEAELSNTHGGRGISFKGVAKNFNARQAQALCLRNVLKGTDIRFIGFLSDWPKRRRPLSTQSRPSTDP